jgi:hypothetical protein
MTTISFKVTADEARLIRSRAKKQGLTVSEYLRQQASCVPSTATKPRKVRCRRTGAIIFAGVEGEAPLTTEKVRELLAEFP